MVAAVDVAVSVTCRFLRKSALKVLCYVDLDVATGAVGGGSFVSTRVLLSSLNSVSVAVIVTLDAALLCRLVVTFMMPLGLSFLIVALSIVRLCVIRMMPVFLLISRAVAVRLSLCDVFAIIR